MRQRQNSYDERRCEQSRPREVDLVLGLVWLVVLEHSRTVRISQRRRGGGGGGLPAVCGRSLCRLWYCAVAVSICQLFEEKSSQCAKGIEQ